MIAALNLPNRITLARLGLAIIFFVLLAQYSHRQPQPWMLDVSVAIFIVAAVTDILDGYIARRRGLLCCEAAALRGRGLVETLGLLFV